MVHLHQLLRTSHVRAPQGGFEAQSISGMQRAVFNGQMSVGDYYERQVGPIELKICITKFRPGLMNNHEEAPLIPYLSWLASVVSMAFPPDRGAAGGARGRGRRAVGDERPAARHRAGERADAGRGADVPLLGAHRSPRRLLRGQGLGLRVPKPPGKFMLAV